MKHTLRFLLITCLLWINAIISEAQNAPQLIHQIDTAFVNVESVSIDGQFCKIEINQSSNEQTKLKGELHSDKNDPAYQINRTMVNGELKIKIQFPAQGWSSHSGVLKIDVPNDKAISISTTSGTVIINQSSFSNVNIASKSGQIEITSCNGQILAESVTGKISISTITGAVKTKTKTGDQYITKVNGKVSSLSSEGNITIADVTGSVRSESTTGKTDIDRIKGDTFAKSATGMVNVADSDGNVNINTFSGPIKVFNITGKIDLQSTAGDQVGTRLNITESSSFKSTEGKIKMQFDNSKDITFNLESTTSYLQALGQSKKKKLKVGKGLIIVTGISTTGGQIYN